MRLAVYRGWIVRGSVSSSTDLYRNNGALSAWFCMEALTCVTGTVPHPREALARDAGAPTVRADLASRPMGLRSVKSTARCQNPPTTTRPRPRPRAAGARRGWAGASSFSRYYLTASRFAGAGGDEAADDDVFLEGPRR